MLDKFSYRSLDQEQIPENLLDAKDYLAKEIELALANAKITTKNIAMSIPVTSAIIRVVRPSINVSRACLIWLSVSVSTDAVASSSTRIGGSFKKVRAIAMRCFSPPESLTPRSPTRVSY